MARKVISTLEVWDSASGVKARLAAGTELIQCRIRRRMEGAEAVDVYVMEFQSAGRQYSCPLVCFQARTETVVPHASEEIPAREAVAV